MREVGFARLLGVREVCMESGEFEIQVGLQGRSDGRLKRELCESFN